MVHCPAHASCSVVGRTAARAVLKHVCVLACVLVDASTAARPHAATRFFILTVLFDFLLTVGHCCSPQPEPQQQQQHLIFCTCESTRQGGVPQRPAGQAVAHLQSLLAVSSSRCTNGTHVCCLFPSGVLLCICSAHCQCLMSRVGQARPGYSRHPYVGLGSRCWQGTQQQPTHARQAAWSNLLHCTAPTTGILWALW